MKKTKIIIGVLVAVIVCACVAGGLYWYFTKDSGEVVPIQEGDFYADVPFSQYLIGTTPTEEKMYDIRDYGASVDAELNTDAINKAIDTCSAEGGGIVLVTGGAYRSGTINLKSNVTLCVAADSSIVASHNFDDFSGALIKAENAENIKITGPGKICGEGEYFVTAPKKSPLFEPLEVSDIRTMRSEYRARIRFGIDGRPDAMVWLRGCEDVIVDNIVLENSMNWTLKLDQCDDVDVMNMVINNNRHVANTDGIDIVGSNDVKVDHCFISTGDDGVVIKNGKDENARAMSDIRISDCEVITCTNAFKIGTETYSDISDVTIEDCKASLPDIYPGSVSGISIESADGSVVSDITVRNLETDQVTCPVFIRLCNRNMFDDDAKDMAGKVENIVIENVTSKNAELPMIISGVEHHGETNYIKNVTMKNINVTYRESEENIVWRPFIPEYPTTYPENWRFKDVPAYGLWARHVDTLVLENVNITPRTANEREEFVYDDVVNLSEK